MNKNKDAMHFILRLTISILLHFCWFCISVYTYMWENSLEWDLRHEIGYYYWTTWWPLPLTAIIFNTINIVMCRKFRIERKTLVVVSWVISLIMSTLLFFPWIYYYLVP